MKPAQQAEAAIVKPANRIVDDCPIETLERAQAVATYLMFTASAFGNHGSSAAATDGLSIVLEALVDALNSAKAQLRDSGGAR